MVFERYVMILKLSALVTMELLILLLGSHVNVVLHLQHDVQHQMDRRSRTTVHLLCINILKYKLFLEMVQIPVFVNEDNV